jgi:hypothetical protein
MATGKRHRDSDGVSLEYRMEIGVEVINDDHELPLRCTNPNVCRSCAKAKAAIVSSHQDNANKCPK